MNSSSQKSRHAVFVLALACPWLAWPTLGPSPSVLQWLLCAFGLLVACTAVLGALQSASHAPAPPQPNWPTYIAIAWLLAGSLSAVMGLLQYFDLASHFDPWVSPSSQEAFANLRQRNQFASLTLIALSALGYLAPQWPGVWSKNSPKNSLKTWPVWQTRTLCGLLVVLLVAADAASTSRTGLMGLVALAGLAWVWRASLPPLTRAVFWWSLPIYVLAAFVLPKLAGLPEGWGAAFSRFSSGDPACTSRLTLWSNVLHLIAQKPWLGWGWGELDYAHFVTLYPGDRFCAILDNAHNLPLHLAVELGVPFALLVCGTFAWWVLRQKPWAETSAARQMAWGIMAIVLLHSMLEYPLWYGPFQVTFLLCMVVLMVSQPGLPHGMPDQIQAGEVGEVGQAGEVGQVHQVHNAPPWSNTPYRLFAVGMVVIGLGLSYVGWDYLRISQIFLPGDKRLPAYRTDTLNKVKSSFLFQGQVQFAELSTTPLTAQNAQTVYQLALAGLHFSPEPMVIERLIESAVMLGKDEEAMYFLQRYQRAFPKEHQAWSAKLHPEQHELHELHELPALSPSAPQTSAPQTSALSPSS